MDGLDGHKQRNALTAAEQALRALGAGNAEWATRGADRVAELDQIGAYARLPEAVTRASRELADHGTVTRGGWEALRASLALGPLQALIDTMAG